jgi:hypothetical protein
MHSTLTSHGYSKSIKAVRQFLRQVFIPVAFNTLKEKSTIQQLLSVMNYIQATWFDSMGK